MGEALDVERIGQRGYAIIRDLFPICRSITGQGVRDTLRHLQETIPLHITEVPSGTRVFDWTVPNEWNIRDAYIKDSRGKRLVDFRHHNLHVMSYSVPVKRTMTLQELKPHLFSLPDHPDWIPYRTSYYRENWGFCLAHRHLEKLSADEQYEVYIDATLAPGSLTYGECYLPGEIREELLISCHVCHPSLCNDNLSGIAVATLLAEILMLKSRRHSVRVLFIPGTIGSITWLAGHDAAVRQIRHGLVLTGVGDEGGLTYKKSRQGNAPIDRAMQHLLRTSGEPHQVIEFYPYGYDERQYCSPGFNLAVGCLMRTPHGMYPEYHSSGDNLAFITPTSLGKTVAVLEDLVELLDGDLCYVNTNPNCEPQLGKRGLYRAVAGHQEKQSKELALLWVLNMSDGEHSLLDIAERANRSFHDIQDAAKELISCGLLRQCERRPGIMGIGGYHE